MQFSHTNLKIETLDKDIKNILKIPSERERLFKIIFCSHDTREKYYASRRLLKEFPTFVQRRPNSQKRGYSKATSRDGKGQPTPENMG